MKDKRADANPREPRQSTKNGSDPESESDARRRRSSVPERIQTPFPLRPARLDLHPQLEVHARLEQRLERGARADADALHLLAARADHDAFLGLAFDQQLRTNVHALGPRLVEALDLHRRGVGQLLLEFL